MEGPWLMVLRTLGSTLSLSHPPKITKYTVVVLKVFSLLESGRWSGHKEKFCIGPRCWRFQRLMIALIVFVMCKETAYGGKSITEQSYSSYDQELKESVSKCSHISLQGHIRVYCFTVPALPDSIKL